MPDAEIELAAGCTINEIFRAFSVKPRLSRRANAKGPSRGYWPSRRTVLATGGGAFMDPDTRARIHEAAISVWLKAPCRVVARARLAQGHGGLLPFANTDSRTAIGALAEGTRNRSTRRPSSRLKSDEGPA